MSILITNQEAANAAIAARVGELNDHMLAAYRAGFLVQVEFGGRIQKPGRKDGVQLLVVAHFTESHRARVMAEGDSAKKLVLQSRTKRFLLWLAGKV